MFKNKTVYVFKYAPHSSSFKSLSKLEITFSCEIFKSLARKTAHNLFEIFYIKTIQSFLHFNFYIKYKSIYISSNFGLINIYMRIVYKNPP